MEERGPPPDRVLGHQTVECDLHQAGLSAEARGEDGTQAQEIEPNARERLIQGLHATSDDSRLSRGYIAAYAFV